MLYIYISWLANVNLVSYRHPVPRAVSTEIPNGKPKTLLQLLRRMQVSSHTSQWLLKNGSMSSYGSMSSSMSKTMALCLNLWLNGSMSKLWLYVKLYVKPYLSMEKKRLFFC